MAKYVIEHYELHRITTVVEADNVAAAINSIYRGCDRAKRQESDLPPLDIADHPILGLMPDNWDDSVHTQQPTTYDAVAEELVDTHDIVIDDNIPEIISITELY